MQDLNEFLYNKPLYPETKQNEDKKEEKPLEQKTLFSSLLGENINGQNLLPLLLGMKGGNPIEMLSKSFGDNPLFKIFPSLESNKKESRGSQKFPRDEYFNC